MRGQGNTLGSLRISVLTRIKFTDADWDLEGTSQKLSNYHCGGCRCQNNKKPILVNC